MSLPDWDIVPNQLPIEEDLPEEESEESEDWEEEDNFGFYIGE